MSRWGSALSRSTLLSGQTGSRRHRPRPTLRPKDTDRVQTAFGSGLGPVFEPSASRHPRPATQISTPGLLWAYAPRDVEVASIIGGCCTAVRRARIPGAVPEAGAPPAGRRPRAVSQFARTRPLHRTAEQITRARIPMHRLSARPASAGVFSAGFQAQIVGQPETRFHERAAASPPPHPTRNAAPSDG